MILVKTNKFPVEYVVKIETSFYDIVDIARTEGFLSHIPYKNVKIIEKGAVLCTTKSNTEK